MIDHPKDCVAFVTNQPRMTLFYDITNNDEITTNVALSIFETNLRDSSVGFTTYSGREPIVEGVTDFTDSYTYDVFVYFQDVAQVAINQTDIQETRDLPFDFDDSTVCTKLVVLCVQDELYDILETNFQLDNEQDTAANCQVEIVRVFSLQQISIVIDRFRQYQHQSQLGLSPKSYVFYILFNTFTSLLFLIGKYIKIKCK